MSYSLEEAIQDRVVPALRAFLDLAETDRTEEALQRCIADATGVTTDARKHEEMCALFIRAMFPDGPRLGLMLQEITWWLSNDEMRLTELQIDANGDLLIEKFDAIKEE